MGGDKTLGGQTSRFSLCAELSVVRAAPFSKSVLAIRCLDHFFLITAVCKGVLILLGWCWVWFGWVLVGNLLDIHAASGPGKG